MVKSVKRVVWQEVEGVVYRKVHQEVRVEVSRRTDWIVNRGACLRVERGAQFDG